jgi:hypothetical protein
MKTFLLAPILCCALTTALTDGPYFPIKSKAGDEGVVPFAAKWYGESLKRMNEPRLPGFAKDANAEVYRIMILPNLGNSIVVRVSRRRRGKVYSLSARRLDGQAGYDPGKLVEAKDIELSTDDSKTLKALVQNLNFFQMATDDDVLGHDDDEWIFEGVSQGKYHVVTRCCAPSENPEKRGLTAFLNLCRFLLDKSRLSTRPQ